MKIIVFTTFVAAIFSLYGCYEMKQDDEGRLLKFNKITGNLTVIEESNKYDTNVSAGEMLIAIKKERERREKIYKVLNQTPEASKIVTSYKNGTLTKEKAIVSLQALIPNSLGPLPPNVEEGAWPVK